MKTLLLIASLVQLPPLPSIMTTAQTATIVNGGVNQDDLDKVSLELQRWGRYRLIEDGGELEIVVTIEHMRSSPMATLMAGVPINVSFLRLSFKSGDTILYSDQTKGGIKKTLERLEKRLK